MEEEADGIAAIYLLITNKNMSFKEDFELCEEKINAVNRDDIKLPTKAIDVVTAESETLAVDATKDKDDLLAANMDLTIIDEVKVLAGALRYCQANWMGEYMARKDAQKQWSNECPKGFELQKELFHNFGFAYRNSPDELKKLKRIKEGTSQLDMVQDLLELGVLGQKYPAPLEAINYDVLSLEAVKTKAHFLSDLRAQANGDKDDYSESKLLRDKAFTLLFEKTQIIREYGRFVFWKNPERRDKYKND